MKNRLVYFFCFVFCVGYFEYSHSQGYTSIGSDTLNKYAKVTELIGQREVRVIPQIFNVGDTVLLIQMKGASATTSASSTWGNRQSFLDAGHYEFVIIDQITADVVRFSRNRKRTYDPQYGVVQLIRVPRFDNANVISTLSCPPWNGETGGILTFIVRNELKLEADIDVSSKGFRGFDGVELSDLNCTAASTDFAFHESYTLAGKKGEGVASYYQIDSDIFPFNDDFNKGKGRLINAGGGGNGKYTGGAGGANGGAGGFGGRPDVNCGFTESEAISYQAPNSQSLFVAGFIFENGEYGKRLLMGGSGGSGTGSLINSRPGGKGGNAGGMVIIMANKIDGNNHNIISNGENASSASGGAGGGGAGGTVALHVDQFLGELKLNIEVKGGNGGNSNGPSVAGSGGGGGGGTILLNSSITPDQVTYNLSNGSNGMPANFASTGNAGNIHNDLKLTLNGFLFQSIREDQLVCQEIIPEELTGTEPFGGVPAYSYLWQKSTDGSSFVNADGVNTESNYQPPVLENSTWYRRIVTDSDPQGAVVDVGLALKIEVVPKITNNVIAAPPPFTICEGSAPAAFTGNIAEGGDGVYVYQWQKKVLEGVWEDAPGISSERDYISGNLTDTTHFFRIVKSSVCVDTTLAYIITINVHPKIENNVISAEQVVCFNDTPADLEGQPGLIGGNDVFSFLWYSNTGSDWIEATGVNTLQNYIFPSELTETTQYRRKVVSGECVDYSLPLEITVLPLINDNIIGSDTTICVGTRKILPLGGGTLTGGSGTYSYSWERSIDNFSFTSTGISTPFYASGILFEDTYFHRIVTSGPCIDTSNIVKISVDEWPVIEEITQDTTLFFKFDIILEASIPVRGNGNWTVLNGSGILSSPNSEITSVTNLSKLENQFLWKVTYLNCFIDSLVNVYVTDIFRPNAFSPNGDGINDFLEFTGLENSLSNEVSIFNRQGNLVFRAKNYQVDPLQGRWDGKDLSGNPVMEDTYYYVLLVNNRFKYQGFIVLKR